MGYLAAAGAYLIIGLVVSFRDYPKFCVNLLSSVE